MEYYRVKFRKGLEREAYMVVSNGSSTGFVTLEGEALIPPKVVEYTYVTNEPEIPDWAK